MNGFLIELAGGGGGGGGGERGAQPASSVM